MEQENKFKLLDFVTDWGGQGSSTRICKIGAFIMIGLSGWFGKYELMGAMLTIFMGTQYATSYEGKKELENQSTNSES